MTNTARSVLLLLSLGAASLAGCSSRLPGDDSGDYNKPGDTPPVTGGGGGGGGGGNPDKRTPCGRMDIVFVVDDSGSMAEEQSNLAQNFPRFIDVLNRFTTGDGKPLDYRVAVTTTGRDLRYKIKVPIVGIELPMSEKGDNGAFRQSCGMQRRWLERGDRDVANTFACAAQVGTGGPSLEMPLYSLNLALKDRVADGTNAGFLRDDVLLATVILTDEDDCSREDNDFTIPSDDCQNADWVQPVKRYLDVLDKVKGANSDQEAGIQIVRRARPAKVLLDGADLVAAADCKALDTQASGYLYLQKPYVAAELARLKGCDVAQIARATSDNFEALFSRVGAVPKTDKSL